MSVETDSSTARERKAFAIPNLESLMVDGVAWSSYGLGLSPRLTQFYNDARLLDKLLKASAHVGVCTHHLFA